MKSIFARIFKEDRINSILVISVFLFFTIWWLIVTFVIQENNNQIRPIWSSHYVIISILGFCLGWIVLKRSGQTADFYKPTIRMFTFGLFCQAAGQIAYSFYIVVLHRASYYPSVGDVFYFGSAVFYLLAAWTFLNAAPGILQKKKFMFVAFAFFLIFCVAQILFWDKTDFVFEWSTKSVVSICYALIENLYLAFAVCALMITRFFRGHKYRIGLSLLCLALISQYTAEFNFFYAERLGTFTDGGYGDYLYLVTYAITGLGLVQFTAEFIAINILVILFNALLLIQLLLSGRTDKYFSNGIILATCLGLSYFLLKRNSKEIAQKEKLARFEALEESNRKLSELDKQKTEFLTIAAHQLRTPVSIINNYIEMIQDGDYGHVDEEVKKVLGNMDQSNQWLVRLADEFLNISKLEQNEVKFHLVPTDLAKIVDSVVAEMAPKAEANGLKIAWNRPLEPAMVMVDEEKIRVCIVNLLDNGVKYGKIEGDELPVEAGEITPSPSQRRGKGEVSSSTITITLTQENKGVAVRVIDHGIGFDKEDEQRLFQKFSRGNNAKGMHVNLSTGLGLYIAKKFVEGHGGSVFASSAGEKKGSVFGIWISQARNK